MVATLTNVKNNSLFNAERKIEYLTDLVESKSISEETSKSYARIFGVTKEYEEEKFKKDLADFNLREIESIFYGFEANNRNTIESYGRIISSYLNWSVKKGYKEENPLASFRPTDFEKYLTNRETYMTDRELRRYEDRCSNPQDSVILRLLFEGLSGKEFSEICNLKKTDVDYDNKRLFLRNPLNNSGRFIEVEERTLYLIREAIKQTTYRKSNGKVASTEHNNVREYTDLVDNEYVIRPSITKTENFNSPVNKYVLYRRIDSISRHVGIEDLTAKGVQRSGMIHYAYKLVKNGELSLDDLKTVAERFNVKSYHNLKGFLTHDNVARVYGEE